MRDMQTNTEKKAEEQNDLNRVHRLEDNLKLLLLVRTIVFLIKSIVNTVMSLFIIK